MGWRETHGAGADPQGRRRLRTIVVGLALAAVLVWVFVGAAGAPKTRAIAQATPQATDVIGRTVRIAPGTVAAAPVTTAPAPAVPSPVPSPAVPIPASTAPKAVGLLPPPTVTVPPAPDACAVALAYLASHAAPGFAHFCRPGALHTALGSSVGYTCVPGRTFACPDGVAEIIIAGPACAASYENEASNSYWNFAKAGVIGPGAVQDGRSWDPFGPCPGA